MESNQRAKPERMRVWMSTVVMLALASQADAQVAVSTANGNTLAHGCYVSAFTTVRSGIRLAHDAIETCNVALNEPITAVDRAATYDNRGILFDVEGNYSAALSDFNESIALDPKLGDAYLNRGVVLIRTQKTGQALDDIQHALVLGVSLPEIGYYDLGVAEQALGQIPQAYADFKRSLAANPEFTRAADALKNFKVVEGPAKDG